MDISLIREKMRKSIDFYLDELKKLRTSRANVGIVEDIKINVYDTYMPLSQLATLSVPDNNVILIQPWDSNNTDLIVSSIKNLNIGLNPISVGEGIKIIVPPLSEERRQDFIKILNLKTEECKVSLRNIRHEYVNKLREDEKESNISKDDLKNSVDNIDNLIKEYDNEIKEIFERKKKDLLEI